MSKKSFLTMPLFRYGLNNVSYVAILVCCLVFVLLRAPSLFEPSWYGDEGIYQVVGSALNEGRILYKEVWDNKPPLLYLIYAWAGSDLLTVKLASLLAGLFSIVPIYMISNILFKNKYVPMIVTFAYAFLFATPMLEGNIANAENFMLLPITVAAYLVLRFYKTENLVNLIFAGFLLSLALATKIVAVFDFTAFILFLFFAVSTHVKRKLFNLGYFTAAFLSFFIVFVLYFAVNGALPDFFQGVFFENVGYVGEQYGSSYAIGILFLKTAFLILATGVIIGFRKSLPFQSFFVYLWVIFGIYSAFFSDRPYIHYLLMLLPPFVLLCGSLLDSRKKMRLFELLLIVAVLFVAYSHFKVYRKNIKYYTNFVQFVTGSKGVSEYYAFFDANTPRDYAVADFIKRNTRSEDQIFLMSDSAQIYNLSEKIPIGKYVVYYHVTYYKDAITDTEKAIDAKKPKFIVKTVTGQRVLHHLLSSYQLKYIIDGAQIYETEI